MKIFHKGSTCIPQALLCALLLAAPGITSGEIVREGDRSPTPSLISEKNQPITLVGERQTLITFIFTRCAAMEFCPRMAKQFEDVQEAIQKKGYTGLRLLSISLDPEFDRPELLKEYANAVGADPATWNFATADPATIDSLTRDFRVHRNKDGGILNHTLCTALISPDGTIKRIWRGNAWTTEEVLEAVGIK